MDLRRLAATLAACALAIVAFVLAPSPALSSDASPGAQGTGVSQAAVAADLQVAASLVPSTVDDAESATLQVAPASAAHAAQVAAVPASAAVRAPLSTMKLVNYYPANNSWYAMWTKWNPAQFDTDMQRAQSIGANAVRLILFPEYFGYPSPTPAMSGRLAQAISIASSHGINVQLTLFDHFSSYGDTAGSATWTKAILAPYATDPRITFVEVQNEVSPANKSLVRWLRAEVALIHSIMPGTQVTASTDYAAGSRGPALLKTALTGELGGYSTEADIFDYHYYGGTVGLTASLKKIKASVAPSPLVLGEIGSSSTNPIYSTGADGQQSEALWLATVEADIEAAGLPLGAPWTLNDFTQAGQPYHDQQVKQYGFGLFDVDGSPKPAAFAIADAFGAGSSFASSPFAAAPKSALAPRVGAYSADSNNPGFAVAVPGQNRPSTWTQSLAKEATFSVVAGGGPAGTNAVQMSRSGGDSTGWPSLMTVPSQAVIPGQIWSLSAAVRGIVATGTNRIGIAWFNANGRFMGWTASPSIANGSPGWTTLLASGKAPIGAASAEIHLSSERNTGSVRFANVTWSVGAR
jgi:hypothetical protein